MEWWGILIIEKTWLQKWNFKMKFQYDSPPSNSIFKRVGILRSLEQLAHHLRRPDLATHGVSIYFSSAAFFTPREESRESPSAFELSEKLSTQVVWGHFQKIESREIRSMRQHVPCRGIPLCFSRPGSVDQTCDVSSHFLWLNFLRPQQAGPTDRSNRAMDGVAEGVEPLPGSRCKQDRWQRAKGSRCSNASLEMWSSTGSWGYFQSDSSQVIPGQLSRGLYLVHNGIDEVFLPRSPVP